MKNKEAELWIIIIKNSVYKKLKVNKKYTYQVIYGKDKVKKTIKFKK